jgi:hypothetical protein
MADTATFLKHYFPSNTEIILREFRYSDIIKITNNSDRPSKFYV